MGFWTAGKHHVEYGDRHAKGKQNPSPTPHSILSGQHEHAGEGQEEKSGRVKVSYHCPRLFAPVEV